MFFTVFVTTHSYEITQKFSSCLHRRNLAAIFGAERV